ncbi:DUF58 domain-containing protein [Litorimonas sp. RW-G-Af-16]|uniref:DUF58 domain-containing protein n=1 Tax=Litorimonas sp. RW-G-Af-16 TaxID=3241168 RepID=UPI003AAAEDCA
MPVQTLSHQQLRQSAEDLASGFPALLAEAERVANIVAGGVHGRRRAGQGETFWQYRNYDKSDPATRIDWRRTARGDQVFIRDNEWEAANSVYIWRNGAAGMNWRSARKLPTKQDRASVITLALASLLMRSGERCAIIGESERPRAGRVGFEQLSQRMARSTGDAKHLDGKVPAHAKMVIASDFLESKDVWRHRLSRLSGRPVSGVLLHIIDPAEEAFPYKGRLEMRIPGLGKLPSFLVGRAENAQEEYQKSSRPIVKR